ncbi:MULTISPECIES: hypothetical protein [Kroppenstedtia]|uniref:Uncharacterized protein n=2 Tax=Kroppenstedtia TaxID=1274351 RepID=A0A1N7NXE6_9BACL|nr:MULTISPECIES: hypothetical protein [Kroppenstedtia]EGK08457.1 hypothetical protein HMPREF9374_3416 [Desmospora sp. 8437]QKI81213.1 hypothetical protein GXN75_03915 [Kroppenstedtia eburnea]GGA44667.1 hypothetical protein GCM10007416_17170 [Kroppenstedtia guangzhouensis]SIT03017.1 hypothetical protein SAMN05421790_110106 [Kroppenstedtia eburnea]
MEIFHWIMAIVILIIISLIIGLFLIVKMGKRMLSESNPIDLYSEDEIERLLSNVMDEYRVTNLNPELESGEFINVHVEVHNTDPMVLKKVFADVAQKHSEKFKGINVCISNNGQSLCRGVYIGEKDVVYNIPDLDEENKELLLDLLNREGIPQYLFQLLNPNK